VSPTQLFWPSEDKCSGIACSPISSTIERRHNNYKTAAMHNTNVTYSFHLNSQRNSLNACFLTPKKIGAGHASKVRKHVRSERKKVCLYSSYATNAKKCHHSAFVTFTLERKPDYGCGRACVQTWHCAVALCMRGRGTLTPLSCQQQQQQR